MKIICITPFNKHDYLTDCTLQGLKELGHTIVHTDEGNGMLGYSTDDHIIHESKTADAALAFWSKNNTPAPRLHLLKQINQDIPTAYIDGSEYNILGHPQKHATWLHEPMLDQCNYYFKRECKMHDIDRGVKPLPFSARAKDFAISVGTYPRKTHVFCAFGQLKMDPIRFKLQEAVANMSWDTKVGSSFTSEEYQRYTSSSKISVNARGGGEDCMRFWEIIAAGTACFTQELNIVIPNPFIDNTSFIEFRTVDEFKEKVDHYLKNPDTLQRIAMAGHQHLKRYHTTQARATYMLNIMGLTND